MERLPSGRVVFLFTDIEGSTRLLMRLGDAFVDLLDRHNTILRAAWTQHRGVEVKTEGDSFLVAFASADDALAAAIDAQQRLASEEWIEGAAVRVRMGLHAGLAAPRDGDYVALAVHQAARIVGAANGGQILVSADTVPDISKGVDRLASLGRYRVRDFDQPVELFAARFGGEQELALPRAVPAEGHNLPPSATPLIGRTNDMDTISDRIDAGVLVTVVGPGGVGKTRLVNEIGRRIAPDWSGGVWFVDLAALPPDSDIAGAVAETLAVNPSGRDPTAAIVEGFADRPAVLLLDNCEHVAEGVAAFIGSMRVSLPRLAWLATSQEALRVAGEIVWRLGPLAPDREAIDLFVDRASRASPGFDPSEAERAVIARICERLDGVPLAIELAAARLDVMSADAVLAGLDDRFRMLRSRERGRPSRQQSLDAMLDWSYGLLPRDQQAVLRRLSLFVNAFTLDGAVVAAAAGRLDAGNVVDGVWSLVDKSLLAVDASSGATRFRQFETVRAYAAALLDDEERRAAVDRVAGWYLDRFGIWNEMGAGLLGDLAAEANNVRGVIRALDADRADTAQLLAVSIAYLHDILGTYVEGIAETEKYVADLATPTTSRAILLASLSRMRRRVGTAGDRAALDEAERLLTAVGPEPDWASGTVGVARALWLDATGSRAEAIALARHGANAAAADDARARWFNALGLLLAADGDIPGAIEAYRAGLVAEERLGNPVEIAVAYNNLAEYELRAGDIADAATHQLHTLTLAAEVGSQVLVAFSMIIASRIAGANLQRWEDAVSLQAAADATLAALRMSLDDNDLAASAAVQDQAREHLGHRFDAIRRTGADMPIEEAIDRARRILVEAQRP